MHEYEFLFPYEHIPRGSKIILYGAGNVGLHYLQQILLTGYCDVVGFADKNAKIMTGGIVPIFSLEELHNIEFDYIVVSVQFRKTYEIIFADLRTKGFPEDIIVYVEPRILPPYDPPVLVTVSEGVRPEGQNSSEQRDNDAQVLINPVLMHDMKIVCLMGGLGNQLYQYIFGRYIEKKCGKDVIFDDMYYFTVDRESIHNGLLVLEDIFPVKIKKLSEFFLSGWANMIQKAQEGMDTWKQLLDAGIKVDVLSDAKGILSTRYDTGRVISYSSDKLFDFVHQFNADNTYYFGYWQEDCMKILRDPGFKKELVEELKFPPFSNPQSKSYAERIQTESSAAIHVRRGDYVSLGWETIPEYYRQCISLLEQKYNPERYYVFSDAPAFCRKQGALYGFDRVAKKIEFVDVNHGTESYNDLHLMTLCKYLVPSLGSTFSRLAWILSRQEMVVASSTLEIDSWYS